MSDHYYPNDQPVVHLNCEKAFLSLTEKEKLYAHHLSKASWLGSLIVLFQTSHESPLIFSLIQQIFANQSIDDLKKAATDCGLADDDFRAFLAFACGFYANMGNYKGFGDIKFIPQISQEKLEKLVKTSEAYVKDPKGVSFLWDNCKEALYSLKESSKHLGFSTEGTTTYFSKHCTSVDADLVKEFMQKQKLEAYNSRVFKDSKTNAYEIRFASISDTEDMENAKYLICGENGTFNLTRGDYSPILKLVNNHLLKAKENAANETEEQMIDNYIKHFKSGDLDCHKDGSRHWIKNKGPVVECYLGFIETYRDPAGMRGEFEGFVAVVNKEQSLQFNELVQNAEAFLPSLPWPSSFEKDKFLQPDFTSLDVVTFAGSGIPAGINIPNYDEIRQNEGFKNVSLGNVLSSSLKEQKPNFLSEEDALLMEKYLLGSFEVQVGLHELLGHGSGKLFRKTGENAYNFNRTDVINPLTNEAIDSWYEEGETFDSMFTSLGSPYEECRAECVGLHLCLKPEALKVFGFEGNDGANVVYVNWLSMVNKGIESLKMYDPTSQRWLQAHSQARYVITRVLLDTAPGLVNIEQIEQAADGNPDLLIHFNRSLINTVGKEAIAQFLLKLQVHKSTGNITLAKELFNGYSRVSDDLEYPYLKFREIVMARKKPRKVFVQSSTQLSGNAVELKSFDATQEGVIQSFLEHINEPSVHETIRSLWEKDANYFV